MVLKYFFKRSTSRYHLNKEQKEDKNIQQLEYDRGHLAPTARVWAARRSIQGTQRRYSPT
ncbi:hypothetical protein PITC_079920 [Penicillium italicum]|uniref:Uncharacterized protein n=1 Tax=Penicillium italicum TaxID=40296 RepID=A0A0A2KFH1_PENIT|nr:hypothetical protein PITC_079920 [Penicillium italicum]